MKTNLVEILSNSGKKKEVVFEGKNNRKSLDESFGKKKMELVSKFIGGKDISSILLKK